MVMRFGNELKKSDDSGALITKALRLKKKKVTKSMRKEQPSETVHFVVHNVIVMFVRYSGRRPPQLVLDHLAYWIRTTRA
jgi:hypothetical protein